MSTTIEIFISTSSAPKDVELCSQLDNVLQTMVQGVEVWHRGRAVDAEQGAQEAAARLACAQVILLLVSLDFLTSASCKAEVTQAMTRREAGEVCVVPIYARPCTFAGQPFANIMGLPRNSKPVASWADRDEALLDIVQELQRVLREMRNRT